MKLTETDCTVLINALDGPSVTSPRAAELYRRVCAERERLRSRRNRKVIDTLTQQAKRDKENQKFAEGLTQDPTGLLRRK